MLGSNGSVVPIFQEQLENGEPLTITHPDMTRFFMTIPEAAWLILDAAALVGRGPVRARHGRAGQGHGSGPRPDTTGGPRPGQPADRDNWTKTGRKLHEELFYDAEPVERTTSPKVLRANASAPPASIREDVFGMLSMATGADEPDLRQTVVQYARGLEGHQVTTAEQTNGSEPHEDSATDTVSAGVGAPG